MQTLNGAVISVIVSVILLLGSAAWPGQTAKSGEAAGEPFDMATEADRFLDELKKGREPTRRFGDWHVTCWRDPSHSERIACSARSEHSWLEFFVANDMDANVIGDQYHPIFNFTFARGVQTNGLKRGVLKIDDLEPILITGSHGTPEKVQLAVGRMSAGRTIALWLSRAPEGAPDLTADLSGFQQGVRFMTQVMRLTGPPNLDLAEQQLHFGRQRGEWSSVCGRFLVDESLICQVNNDDAFAVWPIGFEHGDSRPFPQIFAADDRGGTNLTVRVDQNSPVSSRSILFGSAAAGVIEQMRTGEVIRYKYTDSAGKPQSGVYYLYGFAEAHDEVMQLFEELTGQPPAPDAAEASL